MLLPDVTAILYDPEVGGGIKFQVLRTSAVRSINGYDKTTKVYDAVGNIQPQNKSNQSSTIEDLLNESISVYTTFTLQTGVNVGTSIVEADIILYDGLSWRVTQVSNWSKWGYTQGTAQRTMELVELPKEEEEDEEAIGSD